jgi:hypothetical protein
VARRLSALPLIAQRNGGVVGLAGLLSLVQLDSARTLEPARKPFLCREAGVSPHAPAGRPRAVMSRTSAETSVSMSKDRLAEAADLSAE